MDARERRQAREVMTCSSCGEDDRASEGYPCQACGAFICLICTFRDLVLCRECAAKRPSGTHRRPPGT